MVGRDLDAAFMARAQFLAERGRGRTTPNPIVGAVVVSRSGVVVGQGAHLEAGGPHAEVVALDAARALAAGATLYCTLEPCRHQGRTGPCVERIASAGIRRVVVATRDPNPLVAGAGLADLRARGIDVTEGVGRIAAERVNAPFFTWMTKRRPFVTIKSAVSIDGFVGRRDRRLKLTGPAADRFSHRERAEVDAIAVGSGTVLTDDPLLSARGAYRFRPLVRVLFDWRLQIPPTARVFSTLGQGPVIMVVSAAAASADSRRISRLEQAGVLVERHETRHLAPVLDRLAGRDIVSLLVEGGPTLQKAFCESGLVDRVRWIVTPGALGEGVPVVSTERLDRGGAPRSRILGDDVMLEFDVHRAD
jgi:diaminohydroxyphosphoribosylaminopyrimidine deaminase/5-amino-6-(5-phosphoribosylamino)uracil reductase